MAVCLSRQHSSPYSIFFTKVSFNSSEIAGTLIHLQTEEIKTGFDINHNNRGTYNAH